MAKLTLTDLVNLANESSVVDTINDNNAAIEAALENTLSRDGTLPNSMNSDLDVNSFRIYNLVPPINDTEPVRKKEYDELIDTVEDVYDATNVLYQDFKDKFLGAYASDPTLDNDGDPLVIGALYYNSVSDRMKVYQSSGWSPISSVWHYGVGAPSGGTGENNDYYLSTIGDVYQKSSGVWSGVLFSLKGSDGADGGSVRVIGTLANVGLLPGSGTVGDGYIISGELHVWTGAAWTNVGTITGPTGAQGPIGNTGATGDAGSTIRHGSGVPSNGLGANGDYYLDTDTSDLYYKDSGSYSVVVNIKGDTGATGAAGATGATGAAGATGATGAAGANGADGADGLTWHKGNGVPAGGTGAVGDFYLDLDTSDIYEKTDVATWTSIGSFKGDTGATGAAGSTGSAGADGRPAGVKYTYDSTVTKVDPGAGKVRFNSATASSVTELYIDNQDADTNSVTAWLDALDDSTTTANRGTLFFRANNTGTIGIYQVNGAVVDETGYRTVPVSYVAGTLPSNNDAIYFVFSRTGNTGASGSGSGDMSKSVYDPNDDGKVTNAVNADVVPWSGISSKPTTLSGFGITDGQPLDDELTAIAGLTSAADKVPYFTGAGTAALADLTTAGRALIDDASASDQRTTLGLGSLATKSSIATGDIDADAVTYAKIQNVSATDKILGRSTAGAGDIEEITCTSAARSILDDATTADIATTLGLGTGSSPEFTAVNLGHASDTTLSRSAAGVLAVEGNLVPSPASQAHGDVLYRGASGWERLAAGTSGQFLKTLGAGAAPAWDSASGTPPAINVQTFNSSGTWSKPAGNYASYKVQIWGGGGSGGKGNSGKAGAGGGGGGYCEVIGSIDDLGSSETVTVGAGGASRTIADTDGAAGGSSSFTRTDSTTITVYGGGAGFSGGATGGTGGGGGSVVAVGANGDSGGAAGHIDAGAGGAAGSSAAAGSGGAGTTGGGGGGGSASDATNTNGSGGKSIYGGGGGGSGAEDASPGPGTGGASVFGGNGGAGAFDASNATAGSAPGGGGGGSETGNSGAGGSGRVIVTVW